MRIGDLRHRITLQSPTRTADGMGGYTVVWADEWETWAAIWPISANEIVAQATTAVVATHKVRMRFRHPVSPSWRVRFFDGAVTRFFAIIGVSNQDERDRRLDLVCREVVE